MPETIRNGQWETMAIMAKARVAPVSAEQAKSTGHPWQTVTALSVGRVREYQWSTSSPGPDWELIHEEDCGTDIRRLWERCACIPIFRLGALTSPVRA